MCIKIKCENCGCEDIPANFSAILSRDISNGVDGIWIQCPVCQMNEFYQHFTIQQSPKIAMSQIYTSQMKDAKNPKDAMKIYNKALKALRKKYKYKPKPKDNTIEMKEDATKSTTR